MPSKLPRIAVSLPPHVYETIKRMSELGGEPMSRIIADLITATAEPLMRTVALLEAAAEAPKQVRDGLRQTVADMERELYGVAGHTIGQMDWLINEMGKGNKGAGAGAGPAGAGRAPAAAPVQAPKKAKANPHVVTRGSGITPARKIKGLAKPGKGAKRG